MKADIIAFIQKALRQFVRPTLLYKGVSKQVFPHNPTPRLRVAARFRGLVYELKNRNTVYNLGSLSTLPHPIATGIYRRFIGFNPGNLGNWSDDESGSYATTQMEYEVVHDLIDLYRGDHKKLGGYITSGGTEGNIFSVWLGKTYLEKHNKPHEICLLKTSLTHYSVRKAGQISGLPQFFLPLNKVDWNIDIQGFEYLIRRLYNRGYRGFIIPLTIGYTPTGTSDNVKMITRVADSLKKKLKGVKFYFWIDAALNGLIAPFIHGDFRPFQSGHIQTMLVDFHKFGLVPYQAGVVLYQKHLRKLIEQPIDYLAEKDSTLLGSRSGVPAVSIWGMIHSMGKSGYRHLVEKQMENKKYFLERVRLVLPEVEIVTHPSSLSCGLLFRGLKASRLPVWIEEKYNLYPGKTKVLFYPSEEKTYVIYKCFFLPYLNRRILVEFLKDLQKVQNT